MFNNKVVIQYKDKTVIGLTEKVVIKSPQGKEKEVSARIDTGATTSSIDVGLAADLKLGPILKSKFIKSASGQGLRAVVRASITLEDKEVETEFTLADRSNMKYDVLVGQNILTKGFLIDPSKGEKG